MKCLECNSEVRRIQWTHLKYKCTGTIKSVKEYKLKYPNSPICDDDLVLKTRITLENMIAKYGEDTGKQKWESYREKQRYSNTYEYKKEKYGWTEQDYEQYNKSRSVTLKHMIAKYGEELGNEKWDSYRERQRYTNTLEYFIEREQSVEIGTEVHSNINRMKRQNDVEVLMERHDIDYDTATSLIQNRARKFSNNVSKIEMKFVDDLEERLGESIKYTYKTKQFSSWSRELHSPCFYDVVESSYKLAIEFNGDFWHGNPRFYKSTDIIPFLNKSAKEVWEKDYLKHKCLMERGYKLLTVWEHDYVNNYTKTMDDVIKWWNDNKTKNC